MPLARIIREIIASPFRAACFAVAGLVSIACVTQELSARPGYESSLVLSPVLALLSGVGTIAIARSKRKARPPASTGETILAAALYTFLLPSLCLAVLLAGAAMRGTCGLSEGLAFFILCPVGCCLAGSSAGLVAAMLARRSRLPYLLFLALWVGSAAFDFFNFYFTPKVNVYDPLLGYFAGPLWDEAVKVDPRLLLYRGISLARIAAVFFVFFTGLDFETKIFSIGKVLRSRVGLLALALLPAVFILTWELQVRTGIGGSRSIIREELSKVVVAGDAVLYLPPEIADAQALQMKREVLFRQWQLGKFFREKLPGRARLYFFGSAEMMKKYTGTGPTSVTKPWLGEIYMVYQRPPHPVLKHELAHLYAGRWGSGPLRLPGRLWGLVSDPVLLEGAAVAADWRADPVTPHLTAAASLRRGMLAGWNPFSSVGFFTANRGLSYEASGSFVRFVRETWGAGALEKWYAGETFQGATGVAPAEASRRWRKFLSGLEIPPSLVKEMERLYAAPSIFERRCPHAVAVLYDRIGEAMGEGRVGEALDLAGEIRRMDPANPMHALGKARILIASCRCGESEGARLLGDEALKKTQPLAVYSLAGDIAWAAGDTGRAEQYYEVALESAFDDYNRRLLQIKLWAARQGGELSLLLRRYFVCSEGSLFESSISRIGLLLLMKEKFPDIPLIPYLLGRNLFNEGCYEAAAASLEEALSLSGERPGIPMPRKETLLLLGSCAVNLPGGEEKAREVAWKLEKEKDLSPAESFRLGELKEYLEFVAAP